MNLEEPPKKMGVMEFCLDQEAISYAKYHTYNNVRAWLLMIALAIVGVGLLVWVDHNRWIDGGILALAFIIAPLLSEQRQKYITTGILLNDETKELQINFIGKKTESVIVPYDILSYCYERNKFTMGKPVKKLEFYRGDMLVKSLELRFWAVEKVNDLVSALSSAGVRNLEKCPAS